MGEGLKRAKAAARATRKPPACLTPTLSVLCKLGSIVVHVEEGIDPNKSHPFDASALRITMADPELREWLKEMGALALIPVKR